MHLYPKKVEVITDLEPVVEGMVGTLNKLSARQSFVVENIP